jgi:UDP-glucose 4-epimerase
VTDPASTALVTGCAGFVGSHLCEALLSRGCRVVGVDCFTDYYSRSIKESNIAELRGAERFTMVEADLADAPLEPVLDGIDVVFHLAARPGVRHSFGRGLGAYLRDNIQATQRLLETAAGRGLKAFVYASSSSVYGDQDTYPAREDAPVRPVSPYGSTKVITEQLARAFWCGAGVPVVGLRYFTVYGPRQRPDMAFARFLASSLAGRRLSVLGDGRQVREFTYVEDVVRATVAAAEGGEHGSVYNVGGGVAVAVLDVIALLEELLGGPLEVAFADPVRGDPRRTEADITRAVKELGYRPSTPLAEGLAAQIESLRAANPPVGVQTASGRVRPGCGPREDLVMRRWGPGRAHAERGGPRVLAYSHDGYGLGHLRRNLRVVTGLRTLRPDLQAVLVTGAKSAERLAEPFGVRCVQLPAVVKVANGHSVADDAAGSFERVLERRSAVVADAVREFRPDLLLVDRYPRGMHDELALALQVHAEQRPGAPVVLGLRDILDAPGAIRDEWRANRYTGAIRELYRTVLCYGDPAVYDPIREYGLPGDVAERMRFTGYLADGLLTADPLRVRCTHPVANRRLAVCTLGGGRDAAHIAESFLSAMDSLIPSGWSGVLITGPYMAAGDVYRLRRHEAARSVPVLRMVGDVPSYLAAADAAVCMGGYNTICELMALAVPAVIVPRVEPRQEQRMRAQRLGARGLVWWLEPAQLSARVLADTIESVAACPRGELAGRIGSVKHDGVRSSAQHLAALLPLAGSGTARAEDRPSSALASRKTDAADRWIPPVRRSAEVLLLRHAATGWNDHGRRQGWADQPLTLEGRRAARTWARHQVAEFAAVVSSDLQRARETARIIAAELGLRDVVELAGLREQDQGAWTGLTKEQIKRRWPEQLRERPRQPAGGEPSEAVLKRMLETLSRVGAAHQGRRVLAITHGDAIRTVEHAIGADLPPVPHLEGRWLRVTAPNGPDAERGMDWVRAGDLTAGRRRLADLAYAEPVTAEDR